MLPVAAAVQASNKQQQQQLAVWGTCPATAYSKQQQLAVSNSIPAAAETGIKHYQQQPPATATAASSSNQDQQQPYASGFYRPGQFCRLQYLSLGHENPHTSQH
jgi:hypothetical protein